MVFSRGNVSRHPLEPATPKTIRPTVPESAFGPAFDGFACRPALLLRRATTRSCGLSKMGQTSSATNPAQARSVSGRNAINASVRANRIADYRNCRLSFVVPKEELPHCLYQNLWTQDCNVHRRGSTLGSTTVAVERTAGIVSGARGVVEGVAAAVVRRPQSGKSGANHGPDNVTQNMSTELRTYDHVQVAIVVLTVPSRASESATTMWNSWASTRLRFDSAVWRSSPPTPFRLTTAKCDLCRTVRKLRVQQCLA